MLQSNSERFVVLSSATEDNTMMGEIPKCIINNRQLKVFEGQEGLLVTRNGKAGQTKYLPSGKYTINDHAYILFVKDTSPYEINLKWLSLQYKQDFLSYASNSDNGTWNMTGFFCRTVPGIRRHATTPSWRPASSSSAGSRPSGSASDTSCWASRWARRRSR